MTEIRLKLARLHEAQQQIVAEADRFNVVCCGRRFGKDVMGEDLAIRPLLAGEPVGWINPSYPMLTETWRVFTELLQPVTKRKDSSEHRLELITGGVLDMWSLEAYDSARGRKYKRLIFNEAAMAPNLEHSWQYVFRPTLTDHRGDAWWFSTPKGRNYFWHLFRRSEDGEEGWRSWQKPTAANPYIEPSEIEAARRELPELAFRQEYLAEFLEDGGMVFRRVRDCVVKGEWPKEPYKGEFVIGLDWGRENDFTVATVVEASNTCPRVVEIDRFNKIDWAFQRERVKALYRKWGAQVIVAEKNSIGDPNIEALVDDDIPVVPFVTTNATKGRLIEKLVVAIENREIELPDYPVLLNELEAYEMGRTALGMVTYNAPEGSHDDCVISLALGYMGAHDASGSFIS